MNNLVIASQLSSLEDSIKALTEQFVILKQSISELSTDELNTDELNTDEASEPIDESTNERTREGLVKDILKLTEELGWIALERKPGYYEFKWISTDEYIPIILEDHLLSARSKKGYLTTCGRKDLEMTLSQYKHWNQSTITSYINLVNSLNWVSFGRTSTNRKRLDPIDMSNEQIKEILKRFETIHM